MSLTVGTRIGVHEVTGTLGAGGMGEVYRARDTRLDREVALKVLPTAFTSDPERLARFEREARVLASLNHPNIGGIHGLEESGETRALVLELVEGPTLAERIAQGAIPIDDALPIARQISDALEAAHQAAVIHRDLKPANIKVREDGTVKVLDFGLAKALDPVPDGDQSQSPTLTAAATEMGLVMGTAAYMSPEQARGKAVDKRADVWAFGAVLFEMLTGQRPFSGEDVSLTLAAVMTAEPAWDALPSAVPGRVRVALERCLEKDPRDRARDVGDVMLAMSGGFETESPGRLSRSAGTASRRVVLAGLGVAVLVGALVGGGAVSRLSPPPERRVTRLETTLGAETSIFVGSNVFDVAITPDGSRVISKVGPTAGGPLVVRSLDDLSATPLPAVDRAWAPFVSPGGDWIGFENQGASRIDRVPVLGGGAPVPVVELAGRFRGGSWGEDDDIVFATVPGGLWEVPAGGGEARPLLTPDPETRATYQWPQWLPGGTAVLFSMQDGSDLRSGQVAVLDLDTGQHSVLLPGTFPRYLSTGHLVYSGEGSELLAVGFDVDRLAVTTEPVPVVDGVLAKESGSASFAVSGNGTLVYVPTARGIRASGDLTPVLVNRQGVREAISGLEPHQYRTVHLSDDGLRLALERSDPTAGFRRDVWVHDMGRGVADRLTTGSGNEASPLFALDDRSVVYSARTDDGWGVFSTSDGIDLISLFSDEDVARVSPHGWTPDGGLLFTGAWPGRVWDVALWEPGQPPRLLFPEAEVTTRQASLSRDGRWLAYASPRSGPFEIYVTPFPALSGRTRVSSDGGVMPRWSRDGRELFYIRAEGARSTVMAAPVLPDGEFGTPQPLFDGPYSMPRGPEMTYDVTPDGRFIMLARDEAADERRVELVVVQNWFEELNRLAPLN